MPLSRKTETRKLRAIIVAGFPIFGNFRVAAGFNIVDVISEYSVLDLKLIAPNPSGLFAT